MNAFYVACLLGAVTFLNGCANLKPPKYVSSAACTGPTSLCLLNRLQMEYASYLEGAENSQAIADSIVLGSAAVGVVGAAVGSGSELYKSVGAIGLSALGYSEYGNFKKQSSVTHKASNKLACAKPRLEELLNDAGFDVSAKSNGAIRQRIVLKAKESSEVARSMAQKISGRNGEEWVNAFKNYTIHDRNVVNANGVLSSIDKTATDLLLVLQDSVRSSISGGSFNLDGAVKVITSPPKLDVGTSPLNSKLFSVDEQRDTDKVIDSYNDFLKCFTDEKMQPSV